MSDEQKYFISSYLNTDEKKFTYNRVVDYLTSIQNGLYFKHYRYFSEGQSDKKYIDCKINVFGGFLRYIISKNNEVLNDLDINITYDFSANSLNKILRTTKSELEKINYVDNVIITIFSDPCHERFNYGIVKINIKNNDNTEFNIDLSVSLNRSFENMFQNTADYSVNNLYVEFDSKTEHKFSEIKLRTTDINKFTVEETIEHINSKSLYPIFNFEKIGLNAYRCSKYTYESDDDFIKHSDGYIKYFEELTKKRQIKMLNKGYNQIVTNYLDNINNLITKYVEQFHKENKRVW